MLPVGKCSGCGKHHEHTPVWEGNTNRCVCVCCELVRKKDVKSLFVLWSSGGPVDVDYRDSQEVWLQLPDGNAVELSRKDVEELLEGFDEQ